MNNRSSYALPFAVVTLLFFMWGFITCMNDILIPYLRKMFELSRAQSMLTQMAFFGAYFIGSVVYFLISSRSGDPIQRMGYKRGLILGLMVSALACVLFYPAAEVKVYGLFLTALFILGLGFTVLQIAANPYVAILGSPDTASSRLNLSQAFNSFGTTIAPIIGGYLVFHYFAAWGPPLLDQAGGVITTDAGTPMSAMGVQLPYLIFAGVFVLLALIIQLTHLPSFTGGESIKGGASALHYRHLVFGMLAIFLYVGGEVSIGSVLINYLHELRGFGEMEAKSFLAFYWGGAMAGRFLGAVVLGKGRISGMRLLTMAAIGVAAFALIYTAVWIESGFTFPLKRVLPFLIFLGINLLGFAIGRAAPARTLSVFALIAIGLLALTLLTHGALAMWSVIGIGLFNSIMWSNIFTLAIRGLGPHTSQGSSLLVMAILGGALLPFLQGSVADLLGGYHYSFFLPILCYLYLAWYGWKGSEERVFKRYLIS
ncbi:MAG: sugar MFS transporter, partial [Bacteroidales bacterium]|nr:sugar MFS transporter [Bacteroidales bacterium]